MVLAVLPERVVAPERISVVNRTLAGLSSDDIEKRLGRDIGDDRGIHPAVSFQQAKYDAFPRRAATTIAFPSTAEVRLVNLNLSLQASAFKLAEVEQKFPDALVNSGNRMV